MLNWTDSHSQERICRSPSFLRGDSSMSLEEKKCSPHQRYTAWGWFIWLQWFLPQGKRGTVSRVTGFPSFVGCSWWNSFSSKSMQSTEVRLGGRKDIGKEANKNFKGHKRELSSKPAHEPLGVPHPGISLLDPQAPNMQSAKPTPPPTLRPIPVCAYMCGAW